VSDRWLLEIRTYRVVPGEREALHAAFVDAVPDLQGVGIRVVGHGPSVEDSEHYVLLRAYRSLEELNLQEETFYGGPLWREKHRSRVMPRLEAYHTVVLEVDAAAVDALEASLRQPVG
jgi:hypothetical protein